MASTRNRDPFYINAAEASANAVGRWLQIEHRENIGFQATWSDGVVGTFVCEVSNDARDPYNAKPTPDGRLGPAPLTLPDSMKVDAAVPAGTAGTFYFGFNQIEALWIRFSFVAGDASEGTVDVGVCAKAL